MDRSGKFRGLRGTGVPGRAAGHTGAQVPGPGGDFLWKLWRTFPGARKNSGGLPPVGFPGALRGQGNRGTRVGSLARVACSTRAELPGSGVQIVSGGVRGWGGAALGPGETVGVTGNTGSHPLRGGKPWPTEWAPGGPGELTGDQREGRGKNNSPGYSPQWGGASGRRNPLLLRRAAGERGGLHNIV